MFFFLSRVDRVAYLLTCYFATLLPFTATYYYLLLLAAEWTGVGVVHRRRREPGRAAKDGKRQGYEACFEGVE